VQAAYVRHLRLLNLTHDQDASARKRAAVITLRVRTSISTSGSWGRRLETSRGSLTDTEVGITNTEKYRRKIPKNDKTVFPFLTTSERSWKSWASISIQHWGDHWSRRRRRRGRTPKAWESRLRIGAERGGVWGGGFPILTPHVFWCILCVFFKV